MSFTIVSLYYLDYCTVLQKPYRNQMANNPCLLKINNKSAKADYKCLYNLQCRNKTPEYHVHSDYMNLSMRSRQKPDKSPSHNLRILLLSYIKIRLVYTGHLAMLLVMQNGVLSRVRRP